MVLGLAVGLTGCGISAQELRTTAAAGYSQPEITLEKITKEKAIDCIGKVMQSRGFQPNSVNPHLAIYDKVMDSQASQAFWGRSRTIRITYSLIEDQGNVKVSGNISGLASTNPSILGAISGVQESGSKRTVDLMGKEKYVSYLNELMQDIKMEAGK